MEWPLLHHFHPFKCQPTSGHGNLFSIGVELTFPVLYFGSPTTYLSMTTVADPTRSQPQHLIRLLLDRSPSSCPSVQSSTGDVITFIINYLYGYLSLLAHSTITTDKTRRDEDVDDRADQRRAECDSRFVDRTNETVCVVFAIGMYTLFVLSSSYPRPRQRVRISTWGWGRLLAD